METTTTVPSLARTLERLARMEPVRAPLLSLYLNAQPDSRGKDNYGAFIRKELRRLVADFPPRSSERESIEKDAEAIERWLSQEVRPSANGIAIFACSAAGFFEALQLDAPIESHRLTIGDRPHLASLARIVDRYPRHAVVLADTNHARIYVFGRGRTIDREELTSEKVSRTDTGGWSQLRYQRHVEDHYLHHAKELAERLSRIVAEERAEYVFLAGDEVIMPLLRSHLSKDLSRKVVGVLRLDIRTPENEVLKAAEEALSAHVAEKEAERIEHLRGEWRAGGRAVAGTRKVLEALRNGQADEAWIATGAGEADQIVQGALATSAKVHFVEKPELLADMEGVAASLRYKAAAAPGRTPPAQRKAEA
jgi:peptide chain release factor subunit 1